MTEGWERKPGNRLLGILSAEDRELLRPHLVDVSLPLGHRCFAAFERVEYVHFLEAGLGSDIAVAGVDRPVECGLIGREGLVGIPVVLNAGRSVHTSEMQVAGHGKRIASGALLAAMDQSASLRRVLLNFAHLFFVHTAQTAACNARHALHQRLARWLLMSHDRLIGNDIPLTHEYLATMLGVRRAGVTQALHILEGERLIKAARGQLTVIDRAGLEKASCGCYRVLKDETDRMFCQIEQDEQPVAAQQVSRLRPGAPRG